MWYGVQGSAVGDRTVEMVSGDSSGGMYVISGLSAATVYTVEVAAVNSAGTGVYSAAIHNLTEGIYVHLLCYAFVIEPHEICNCILHLQLKFQSCQSIPQQMPPSPSPGLVLAQRWIMR